jgi:hypothetical protein
MDENIRVATELAELAQAWCGTPFDPSGSASDVEVSAAERELGIIFPKSYRAFLRHYGAGSTHYHEIFGLPRDRLWGDVVMMNQLASSGVPKHYVKFTSEVGDLAYYLDTSRVDSEGECPVVVFGPGGEAEIVADSFIDFLRKASERLI